MKLEKGKENFIRLPRLRIKFATGGGHIGEIREALTKQRKREREREIERALERGEIYLCKKIFVRGMR